MGEKHGGNGKDGKNGKNGTSSKGVGDVDGKAFAGEGAPGWEECPGNKYFLVSKWNPS